MTKQEKIKEIINGFTSFNDKKYFNKDMIKECYNFQQELLVKTFGVENDKKSKRKFLEILDYYESLNKKHDYKASAEIKKFRYSAYELFSETRHLAKGRAGEKIVDRKLETLRVPCEILKNVELTNGDRHCEIDFIVLTQKAIYLLEVKNTVNNVELNEHGQMIRKGKRNNYTYDIGASMNEKEFILRSYLEEFGIKNPNIISLVVFTENIEVENEFGYVKYCFLNSLPYLINSYNGDFIYSLKKNKRLAKYIQEKEVKYMFCPNINIEEIKYDYAAMVAIIEALEQGIIYDDEVVVKKPFSQKVASIIVKTVEFITKRIILDKPVKLLNVNE